MNARIAIVVDVANFDDVGLGPLPGARADGDRVEAFARDPNRGAFTHVMRLTDPTLQQLKERLADAIAVVGSDPSNMALIYFATHGLTTGPYGLYLAVRDARVDRSSTSMFALSELTALIEEHRPTRTITIVDACESGGHVAGTASLSRDKLWRDLTRPDDVREGHFFAVACATRESAHEDNAGGEFTSALLAAVDAAGRDHPSVEWLSVEQVMNDLIRAELAPQQTPEWTGIAVSLSVFLARNPHHDPALPIVHSSVLLPQLDASERALANRAIRLHWNAMQLVGTGHAWLDTASAALAELTKSLPTKAEGMVKQMFTSLDQTVTKYGNADDRLAQIHYSRAVIVAVGQLAPGSFDIDEVVRLIADRIETEINDLQAFFDQRAWLVRGDAPSNAALSTIRFWRRLGAASFVALCARASRPQRALELANLVQSVVASKPELRRVVWMGQYCDLACTMGLIACVSDDVARNVATAILDRLINKTDQPTPPNMRGRDLGRALALTMLGVAPDEEWVDEGIPLCLAQLRLSNEVADEMDRWIDRLSTIKDTDWAFYEEEASLDFTCRTMSIREPSAILPKRPELVAFTTRVEELRSRRLGPTPTEDRMNMLLGLSGAAHFQNRAGIWAVAHMREHWSA
ncbi:MAG: caspase domain-containing protein [Kofleriaceae bacterium]